MKDDAPADATVLGTHRMEVESPGRTLVWDAELSFRSDRENFHYSYRRRLSENGKLLREKPGPEPYRGITSDEPMSPTLRWTISACLAAAARRCAEAVGP